MEINEEQAKGLALSKFWEDLTNEQIVKFQLFTRRLCMPFSIFHRAVEKVLGRPVFTHEFGSCGHLKEEFLGEKSAPTLEEIIKLIPKDKQILIFKED